MDDDLKQIELEAAKIKLQREQLFLQKELDGKKQRDEIVKAADGFFGFIINTIFFLITEMVFGIFGAIFGGFIWCIIGVILLLFRGPSNEDLSFMGRIGWSLGSMSDWVTSILFILFIGYYLIRGIAWFTKNRIQ